MIPRSTGDPSYLINLCRSNGTGWRARPHSPHGYYPCAWRKARGHRAADCGPGARAGVWGPPLPEPHAHAGLPRGAGRLQAKEQTGVAAAGSCTLVLGQWDPGLATRPAGWGGGVGGPPPMVVEDLVRACGGPWGRPEGF